MAASLSFSWPAAQFSILIRLSSIKSSCAISSWISFLISVEIERAARAASLIVFLGRERTGGISNPIGYAKFLSRPRIACLTFSCRGCHHRVTMGETNDQLLLARQTPMNRHAY